MLQLKYEDYLNKVHGGWLGKCIGGAVGALQENNKNLMQYTMHNVFPDNIPPNDDLDLQVLWLQEVLWKKGSHFTSRDIAEAFAGYNKCMANEYGVAIKNIELGIEPPLCGVFNNSYFKYSMGCPIRSEIWGFICPGNPDSAVHYAELDGMVDHGIESIRGEQFYAAIEANAFFEKDIMKLIRSGLEYVDKNSELSHCINFIIQKYQNGTNWIDARRELVNRFGSADASYSVVNVGITIIALLYGESDFTKTMLTAVNSGFDTDCTAATAGAVLGQIVGAAGIPEYWLNKIGKELVIGTVDIFRSSNLIIDLAKDTCAVGLSLARDNVISINFTDISVDVKPFLPKPVPKPQVEINTIYSGRPTIGYGEKSGMTITLKNNSGKELKGKLILKIPESFLPNMEETNIDIPSGGQCDIPLEFEFKKNINVIPMQNIVKTLFIRNDEIVAEKSFGFVGAYRMKLIGPFWDNYNTKEYIVDPYENKQQRIGDRLDLYAMFNGFVDIDRPYIDESFENIDEFGGEYVNFHEDKLELDEKIGYRGPCCVYLVYDFECTADIDDAELFIGNNAPYKIWLNGEMVSESKTHPMWMIFNNKASTRLKCGNNRLIIKVIRTTGRFEFSFLFRSSKFNRNHYLTNLGSLIH